MSFRRHFARIRVLMRSAHTNASLGCEVVPLHAASARDNGLLVIAPVRLRSGRKVDCSPCISAVVVVATCPSANLANATVCPTSTVGQDCTFSCADAAMQRYIPLQAVRVRLSSCVQFDTIPWQLISLLFVACIATPRWSASQTGLGAPRPLVSKRTCLRWRTFASRDKSATVLKASAPRAHLVRIARSRAKKVTARPIFCTFLDSSSSP